MMNERTLAIEAGRPEALPADAEHPSLLTPLGLVEGEVLLYLEGRETATLRQLNQELRWPAYMVMMAVGALIRSGLVRGIQRDLEVIVKLRRPLAVPLGR